ncbi:hypothetical protein HDV00_012661 [Rhizophlyctis rosea]|nr:hypothetical protein HDV00_012661 [Rhizophlyctis rosea]
MQWKFAAVLWYEEWQEEESDGENGSGWEVDGPQAWEGPVELMLGEITDGDASNGLEAFEEAHCSVDEEDGESDYDDISGKDLNRRWEVF